MPFMFHDWRFSLVLFYITCWYDLERDREREDNTVGGDGDLCSMINGSPVSMLVQSPDPANTALHATLLSSDVTKHKIIKYK